MSLLGNSDARDDGKVFGIGTFFIVLGRGTLVRPPPEEYREVGGSDRHVVAEVRLALAEAPRLNFI